MLILKEDSQEVKYQRAGKVPGTGVGSWLLTGGLGVTNRMVHCPRGGGDLKLSKDETNSASAARAVVDVYFVSRTQFVGPWNLLWVDGLFVSDRMLSPDAILRRQGQSPVFPRAVFRGGA